MIQHSMIKHTPVKHSMNKHTVTKLILPLVLGSALALPAQAETWQVDIDTTSLAGIGGYLDIQLNPGAYDAQFVQAQISNFSTSAVLGAGVGEGVFSGALPGVLVLDNTAALNAWLQGLVFGSHIAFTLDIDSALNAGSGSRFSTLLWDADFNPLLAMAGEDAALRLDLMPGSAPSWMASSYVQVSAVPEPNIAVSLLAGLGLIGLSVRRRFPV